MFDGWVRDAAAWRPRAPAVVTPMRTVGYAELDADIDRFGRALADLGPALRDGVVSVCVDNPWLTLVLTGALARLGIASSPYNDPGAAVRLIEREGAGNEAPGPHLIMLSPAWQAATQAAPHQPLPTPDVAPDAVGRVMLSSGTTRAARRVAMTWRRIEAANHAALRTYAAARRGPFAPLTTVESMLGFTLAVAAWSQGAPVAVGVPAHDLPAFMEEHPEGGVAGLTPTQLRGMLRALPLGFRPQPAWRLVAAGSLLPPALAREARLRLTPDLTITYGATESSVNAYGPAADLELDPGLVGAPPAGVMVEILDDEGKPVADGQPGEIRLRSGRMSDAYLDDSEASAERFRDGWFHTGDVGRRWPDGRLVLEGRVDDRINLGGTKYMPAVIEQAAGVVPGVRDAAAFAAPEAAGGLDECWLAVVAEPGFDRASLAPHLAARRDLPKVRLAWVNEIPRNAMGKIERTRLRDAVLAATSRV